MSDPLYICDELFPELSHPAPKLIDGDDVVTEGTYSAWATFSVCRTWRYILGRIWDPDRAILVCGMLNPSKAGAFVTDPTVTRVVGFAKRDHFGGTIIWNAMALVSTDPRALAKHADPVGPRNYEAMRAAIDAPLMAQSVAAWGKPPDKRTRSLVGNADANARALRTLFRFGEPTKEGWPRHPLYLPKDTPIVKHEVWR
jgi:hypothetical protein